MTCVICPPDELFLRFKRKLTNAILFPLYDFLFATVLFHFGTGTGKQSAPATPTRGTVKNLAGPG